MPPGPGSRAFRRAFAHLSRRVLFVALVTGLVLGGAVVTLSPSEGGVSGAGALAAPRSVRARVPIRVKASTRQSSAMGRSPAGEREPASVAFFGDSLAHEAKAAYNGQLARRARISSTVETFPTTALCDFRTAIAEELLTHRPGLLVLEFSGNSSTACMRDRTGTLPAPGSNRWLAHYLDDVRGVLAIAHATGTTVLWATAPPISPTQYPSDYPRRLAAAIRKLATTFSWLRVADTGEALTTDGHSFSHTLPCRPDESAYCERGQLVARSDDGLHFDCHGVPDRLGACIGYSAGARRFGEAIANAAADSR